MICVITTGYAEGEVLHAVDLEFPPFMYLKNGEPAGLSVELLNAMLLGLEGIEVKIDFCPMKRALKMVANEKNSFKLLLTRNPKREKSFKWVGPTFPRIIALYKLKSRPELQINSISDVKYYKVGCGSGYAAIGDLLKAGVSRSQIEEVYEDRLTVKMLFRKRIDFIANNNLATAYLLREEGYSFQDVRQSLILEDRYPYYYGFNKGTDDKIIRQLQQSLDILRQKGTLERLIRNYLK